MDYKVMMSDTDGCSKSKMADPVGGPKSKMTNTFKVTHTAVCSKSKMPDLADCCCCFGLKEGVKTIAVFLGSIALFSIIESCIKINSSGATWNHVLQLIEGFFLLIGNFYLFAGAKKKLRVLLFSWMILYAFEIALQLVNGFSFMIEGAWGVALFQNPSPIQGFIDEAMKKAGFDVTNANRELVNYAGTIYSGSMITSGIIVLLFSCLEIYFWSVVKRLYNSFKPYSRVVIHKI